MSFLDKIKDVTYINRFEQFLHRGSNEIFVVSLKSAHSTRMCSTVSEHSTSYGKTNLKFTTHQYLNGLTESVFLMVAMM